jgi:Uri superfamily endonuclease
MHRKLLTEKGTYTLVMRLAEDSLFDRVGRTGRFQGVSLRTGYYTYVGSAHGSGGTRARVNHHLRDNASHPIWHLDSIRPAMVIEEAWVTYDPIKRECQWSDLIHRDLGGQVPVPGLGSADCDRCPAHFYYFRRRPSYGAFTEVIREVCIGHAPVQKIRLA